MNRTVDCGEGKCHLCIGWGATHFLFPQLNDGKRFECSCPCHKREAASVSREGAQETGTPLPVETPAAGETP